MPDFYEPFRQQVQTKAADKLRQPQRQRLAPVAIGVIFIPKRDRRLCQRQQAPGADGHSVRIAAQIGQHLFRSGKRRLGIHHPLLTLKHLPEGRPSRGPGQRGYFTVELQFTLCVERVETRPELAPKDSAQRLDGKQIMRAGITQPDPFKATRRR